MKNEWEEIIRGSAKGSAGAMHILRAVFRSYPGSLALRPVRDMVISQNPLKLAEAYFNGQVDVEGDLYRVLALKDHLPGVRLPVRERLGLAASALAFDRRRHPAGQTADGWARRRPLLGRIVRGHLKRENEQAISFHYDVSNDFYRLWLDERMVYSCAYFGDFGHSLEQAQCNKLDHAKESAHGMAV